MATAALGPGLPRHSPKTAAGPGASYMSREEEGMESKSFEEAGKRGKEQAFDERKEATLSKHYRAEEVNETIST